MLVLRRAVLSVPPEIWEAILQHLAGSPSTLASAARAFRRLFEPAARTLWRAPPQDALLRVPDPQRRQLYGRAVRTLSVMEAADGPLDLAVADWRFPGVRTVCYDFYTAPQRPDALAQLLARCGPRLARVKVNRYNPWWDADEPPPLHPHNRCSGCSVPEEGQARLAGDTLACLARQAGLRRLSSRAHIQRGTVDACRAPFAQHNDAARPFGDLQRLAVKAADAAMPGLIELVAHAPLAVPHLTLSCDARPPFFALLARLSHLRELEITRDGWPTMDATEFANLGQLPSGLQHLHLGGYIWSERDPVPALTDKVLSVIVAGLPNLRLLEILLAGQYTPSVLRSLASGVAS